MSQGTLYVISRISYLVFCNRVSRWKELSTESMCSSDHVLVATHAAGFWIIGTLLSKDFRRLCCRALQYSKWFVVIACTHISEAFLSNIPLFNLLFFIFLHMVLDAKFVYRPWRSDVYDAYGQPNYKLLNI